MAMDADNLLMDAVSISGDGVRVVFVDGLEGTVSFEEMSNGDHIETVREESLEKSGGRRVEFVTSEGGSVEYPWDFFRRILDTKFEEFEEEESKNAREKLGAHIRELRKEKSLSQEELAERSGLDRTTISRLERGKHQAGFDTLHSIASGLQVSIQEVVKIDENVEEHAA